jgi:Ca-activated chloride channel homolog
MTSSRDILGALLRHPVQRIGTTASGAIVCAALVLGCPAPPQPADFGGDPSTITPARSSDARLEAQSQRKSKVRKEKKDLLGNDPDLPVVLGRPMSEIYFEHYGVNPTIDTEEESVSSFGLDVDTASYALARALLEQDELPEEASVRVEEFINYFDYAYPPPAEGDFALHAEVVPSSKRPGYHVLQLGVRARDLEIGDRDPANLVFLIDASGSMAKGERMPLVRDSLRLLVDALDHRDWISIVSYSDDARVVLEPTPGHERERILAGIDDLHAEGSTNVKAGLRVAYELASRSPLAALYGPTSPAGLPTAPGLRAHIDRVLLCSDGLDNTEAVDAEMLLASVADKARRGISMSTVGVGMGSYHDAFLEELAVQGNGRYAYVDRLSDARRVFVENLTGTLQVVGIDAKVQVEFDTSTVARYRLVGYETRVIGTDPLASERGDDGEIGAGHSVTAMYEIQLRDSALELLAQDQPREALEHLGLGTIRLRYRRPGEDVTTVERMQERISLDIAHATPGDAPPTTQLAIVVAAFAEKLRGSYWIRSTSWQTITELFDALPLELQQQPEVIELGALIRKAARIDRRAPRTDLEAAVTRVDFDRVPVLR